MHNRHLRQNTFAVLAAFLWGSAFVAQSVGAQYVQPFTFNALRSAVGFIALLLVVLFMRLRRRQKGLPQPSATNPHYRRNLLIGGLGCGTAMATASALQQSGMATTDSGKAGFITALYIVIVPILGLFFHKKAPWTVWCGIAAAVCGLYFLCVKQDFSIEQGDFLILCCSFCFSVQILLIDHFVKRVDAVELSCAQLLVTGVLSAALMLMTETPSWEAIGQCGWELLYVGIFSSGVAYTLQIFAQKGSNPTVISLLLSLEAVFATLAGVVILHDQLDGREIVGCVLMLAAVVLAQLPTPLRRRSKKA